MATLANFRTSIEAVLGLDPTAAGADETELDRRVNEGVVDILLRTGCYVTSATATETSGTGDYTLDSGVITVKGWQWSGNTYTVGNVERVSVQDLLAMRANSSSSSPAVYYALAGSNLLMVYPTPSSSDTITFYYVPRPTAMSSGSHDPSNATYGGIPAEFHPAIETYALWKLADMDDDQSSGQGERYRQQYEEWIKTIRKYVAGKAGPPASAKVNAHRRRPAWLHDNSTYYSGT